MFCNKDRFGFLGLDILYLLANFWHFIHFAHLGLWHFWQVIKTTAKWLKWLKALLTWLVITTTSKHSFLFSTESHKVLKSVVNTRLMCQNNRRVRQSYALSHPFSSAYVCQSERANEQRRQKERERERKGNGSPHNSTVTGSIRKLFISVDLLHPSIDPLSCPKTTASHMIHAVENQLNVNIWRPLEEHFIQQRLKGQTARWNTCGRQRSIFIGFISIHTQTDKHRHARDYVWLLYRLVRTSHWL